MAVIPKMLKMQEGCFVGVNLTRSNVIELQFQIGGGAGSQIGFTTSNIIKYDLFQKKI